MNRTERGNNLHVLLLKQRTPLLFFCLWVAWSLVGCNLWGYTPPEDNRREITCADLQTTLTFARRVVNTEDEDLGTVLENEEVVLQDVPSGVRWQLNGDVYQLTQPRSEQATTLTLHWRTQTVAVGTLLGCIGEPDHYRAFEWQEPEAKGYHVELWYPDQGMVWERSGFLADGAIELTEQDSVDVLYLTAPDSIETIRNTVFPGNLLFYRGDYVKRTLQAWQGLQGVVFMDRHRIGEEFAP